MTLPVRFPTGPLVVEIRRRGYSRRQLERVGIVVRLDRATLSERTVDRICVAIGTHPGAVYPEWWGDE